MNKTGKYLDQRQNVLSIYLTSDYPQKGDTAQLILALQEAGVDLIEVGIPFSDPLADGPVIQESSAVALRNDFRLIDLFADLEKIKDNVKIPLVLMGYFNTVLAYGVEKFLKNCQKLAVDTLILPDLPAEIYVQKYKPLFEKYGVSPVFLITPQTTPERLAYIESLSEAFIYAVSDNKTTGISRGLSQAQTAYFERLQEQNLKVPTLIGFGISDRKTFQTACQYSQGAIIGSAFIKALTNKQDIETSIFRFAKKIMEG